MDLAGLELTHIWFKGPMHLAPGVCPCPAFITETKVQLTEELSASFVG
jgi:hypothetical protein